MTDIIIIEAAAVAAASLLLIGFFRLPFTSPRAKRFKYGTLAVVVVLSLIIGYIRLPYAAVRSLWDYKIVQHETVLYLNSDYSEVSAPQAWWIKTRLPIREGEGMPRIVVKVRWYALLFARVDSFVAIGPEAAEGKDSLYFWCFGFWFPVYNFHHVMA